MISAVRPVRALAGLLLLATALEGCSDEGAATPRAGGSAAAGGPGGTGAPGGSGTVQPPYGRALAYRSRVVDGDQQREVVRLLSRDGVDAGALSVPPRGQTDGPPVWAPDGASVATVRTTLQGKELSSRIVLLTFGGEAPRTLVEAEWSDLAFPPDARTLAALKAENGVGKDLGIVDLRPPKATCPAQGEPQTCLRSCLHGWVR